jgi:nitroreductase
MLIRASDFPLSSVVKMEVFEAIRTRRSIRAYDQKPVEEEKLRRVLEAARLAPSAGNRKPWRFIVVTDPEVKENLRPPHRRGLVLSAPVIIVGCAIPSDSFPGTDFWKIDVTIALENLVLAAW